MSSLASYLRLTYRRGGRVRPEVDCWGLYRLRLGEARGIWLAEFEGVEAPLAFARRAQHESVAGGWLEVALGEERPFDAVLMKGRIDAGGTLVSAPSHVGSVVEPGLMIDIEGPAGVLVRPYRGARARPELVNRVIGIFRPRELA